MPVPVLKRIEPHLKLLPDPLKRAAKAASGPADVGVRALYRRRTGDQRPLPPAALRARVGAGIRPEVFNGGGRQLLAAVEQALALEGRSLRDAGAVYDWGCGSGRLLRHLEGAVGPQTRILGSDVDGEAIAWASRAFPRMELRTNGFAPPLPAADGEVDVLVSSSIVTHLTEADQDAWLADVARVLAPGGIALITTAGPRMLETMRGTEDLPTRGRELHDRLAALPALDHAAGHGFLFEPYEVNRWNRRDFTGITGEYGLAFHDPAYVRDHWSQWFEVAAHHETAVNTVQDLYVLRARPA